MNTEIRAVARPEHVRKHNLGLLLRHLHLVGSVSRSELVTATGLNRSTIAALVGEMAERDLVSEHPDAEKSGAGRPSYMVTARPGTVYVIAVDLDVRTVEVAAVGLTGRVLRRRGWRHLVEQPDPQQVVASIAEAVERLAADLAGATCVGVAVSVPGMVRAEDGRVLNAPNLQWHHAPFGELLTARLGRPVRTANDADLAAMAEQLRGAGAGFSNLVCILGRNGVGGGLVVEGRALHGATGYAGELGHMVVDRGGPRCHCGNRGCLEEYAGARAILRAARQAGGRFADVSELFAAADLGDPVACRVVAEVTEWVAMASVNIVTVLDPEAILFVGHLGELILRTGGQVRHRLARSATADPDRPVAVVSGALPEPILTGAAELAFEDLFTGDLSLV